MSLTDMRKAVSRLMSLYVRLRDDNTCIFCGGEAGDATHFIHGHMDYEEMNLNCCCRACHTLYGGNVSMYATVLDLKYGDGTAQKLWDRRYETHYYTTTELEEIEQRLERKIGELNGKYI